MAWTAPRTWSPGETVTASLMNTHLRDNLLVLKTNIDDDGNISFAPSFQPQMILYRDHSSTQSSGGSDITGASASINLTDWFSEAGDTLIIESWGYVTAATWSIKHEINSVAYHTMTDAGFGGATLHWYMITRVVYVTSSTQQIFGSWSYFAPASGSYADYRGTWPTTANTNGANTPGTGSQTIRQRIADADNNLRVHGFQISAIPKTVYFPLA